MALALVALMTVSAFAGGKPGDGGAEGDITISVSCDTDPETVSIANNLEELPISIVEISSLNDPRENEPFFIGEELAAGESVTFESGAAADERVLTNQFIFDNDAEDEGVAVTIGPEPILQTLRVECNASPDTFEILDGKMPDGMGQTGAGGMAGGAGLPVGNLAAAASLILAGGYVVLRRR